MKNIKDGKRRKTQKIRPRNKERKIIKNCLGSTCKGEKINMKDECKINAIR